MPYFCEQHVNLLDFIGKLKIFDFQTALPVPDSVCDLFNDLVTELKKTGCGIPIGLEMVGCLLYAEDIFPIADSEAHLQVLLNAVNSPCVNGGLRSTCLIQI